MKKLDVNGDLFLAIVTIKNVGSFKRVYELETNENIVIFAQKVYSDLKNEFPKYTEMYVSEYGDMEAYPIIDIYINEDDPSESTFDIISDDDLLPADNYDF